MNAPRIPFTSIEPLQDYYRDSEGNLYSVARLVDDTKKLKPFAVPLAALSLSDVIWDDCNMFALAFHVKKVVGADLSKPIILDWNGDVADGRHRIIKALMQGKKEILAVRMTWKIEPCRLKNG